MNREQRRLKIRQLQKNGMSKTQAKLFVTELERLKQLADDDYVKEGRKVKLNVPQMQSHPEWDQYNDKYREWVLAHADEEFTVEYSPYHRNKPVVVCLAEDTSDPKWQFWTGDLIYTEPVEQPTNPIAEAIS